MYYLKILEDDDSTLIYYCRNCGTEDNKLMDSLDDMCVSKTYVTKQNADLSTLINQYTKLDPTLPRVKNIPCPNSACSSNRKTQEGENTAVLDNHEVIYIRYDDSALKFVYICNSCDTVWKSIENK